MVFSHVLLIGSIAASVLTEVTFASSEVFLGSRGQRISEAAENGIDLLYELEKVAGSDHRQVTEARATRLEDALRPTFAAMPKDHAGLVDSVSIRYMLHRLFVQRHGWFVTGLDAGGDAWNSSSPAAVFKDHAGDHNSLFDDKLRSHNFTLHQVAVFAATLETLVHSEGTERLQAAYRVLGLSQSESLSDQEGSEVIQAYMLMYVQQTKFATMTPGLFRVKLKQAIAMYPTWPDNVKFAEEIRQQILEDKETLERNTWHTNLKIVEEIAERYGRWQDKECRAIKRTLLEIEKPGTGRVQLSDFYAPALYNESWMFTESKAYLQQLGALDESNPQRPSVIISNYMNSPVNCVASSKFYSVCCIDQCEELLGTLERHIAAPDATPARIVEIVSGLSSDTVSNPLVSTSLLRRLDDIAAHHGDGLVPLHGRLFAQWLHHAYPRECPYPHMAGTTKPLSQEEYEANSNEPLEADRDDVQRVLSDFKLSAQTLEVQASQSLPWSHEEELFVNRPRLPKSSKGGFSIKHISFAMAIPLIYVVSVVLRLPSLGNSKVFHSSDHKYYV